MLRGDMEAPDVEHGRMWEAHVGAEAEPEPRWVGLDNWMRHEAAGLWRRTNSLGCVGWWTGMKSPVRNQTW